MRVRSMAYAILFAVVALAVSSPALAQTAPALEGSGCHLRPDAGRYR